jgi:nucleotide-binding universal stress UspA family protein
MAYKTILVHLHDIDRAPNILAAAVPIARAEGAHLVGLAVQPPYVVVPASDGAATSITIDEHRQLYARDVLALRKAFEDATAGQTFTSEWRQDDAKFGTGPGVVIEHARTADLTIVSQKKPDWPNSSLLEQPDRLSLEIGRPLLVVPNRGTHVLPPRRVTIAWNGTREAARAAFDALPLLQSAEAVNVLSILTSGSAATNDLPGAEISAALSRHGVKCEATQATAIEPNVGSEIQRLAKAFGSDLLVMGCYGHSRLREFILGGASRDVFAHMTRPVLMSH